MKKILSGWSNSILANCKIHYPETIDELKKLIKGKTIARGLGRSYGDSSIQPKSTIITTKLNKIIFYDKKKGILEAESGISIKEILPIILKDNWFLPVTPGTKKITLGGMVAANVHGKNHHNKGSFKNYIINLKIVNKKKKIIECSKNKNKFFFNYSVGGMGLTGIIYSCKFRLKKIKSYYLHEENIKSINLKETFRAIKKSKNWEYNVAWIDTSANFNQLGRSILTRAKFTKFNENNFDYKTFPRTFKIPKIFPDWFMNAFSIKLLNSIYFYLKATEKKITNIYNFFYPLDKISNWNVVYGKKGFISYQFFIPTKKAYEAIKNILTLLKNNKIYSFVSVLKSMGKASRYLSFGSAGFTMVFDFPLYNNILDILNKIDNIVLSNNGRLYLAKDSRIDKKNFKEINKEFYISKYRKFRNLNSKTFQSAQSERLGI
jgi:FAD/FMN-containing dehydrogenase